GVVVGHQADPAEAGVGLDPDVPGAGPGAGEGAGFGIAAAPRTAVIAAVGRRTAPADIEVRIAAAARDPDAQVAGTRWDLQGVDHVVAAAGRNARNRDALGKGAAAGLAGIPRIATATGDCRHRRVGIDDAGPTPA